MIPAAASDALPDTQARAAAGVEISRASVHFGAVTALDGVSVRIAAGELVGLIGPSGSGKTTLLRLCTGAALPTAGAARVLGQDVSALKPPSLRRLRTRIGFVHQDYSLVPNVRVYRNVAMGRLGRMGFVGSLRAICMPTQHELTEIHAILERVGIGEKLYHRTDHLSGGQQQRVAIARALRQDPELLLADEPVSSVDPARARSAVNLLTEVARERGLTLIMSLHNLDLARKHFPRLIGLRSGKVSFDAPTSRISAAAFDRLYTLGDGELLADGSSSRPHIAPPSSSSTRIPPRV